MSTLWTINETLGPGCSVAGSTVMTVVLTGTVPALVVVGRLLPNGVTDIAQEGGRHWKRPSRATTQRLAVLP